MTFLYNRLKSYFEQRNTLLLITVVIAFVLLSYLSVVYLYPRLSLYVYCLYKGFISIFEFATAAMFAVAFGVLWLICGIIAVFALGEILYRMRIR